MTATTDRSPLSAIHYLILLHFSPVNQQAAEDLTNFRSESEHWSCAERFVCLHRLVL